jgi:hypothetical protein
MYELNAKRHLQIHCTFLCKFSFAYSIFLADLLASLDYDFVQSSGNEVSKYTIFTQRLSSRPGTRGSLVGSRTMLQARKSRIRFPIRSLDFSIYLILPAAL